MLTRTGQGGLTGDTVGCAVLLCAGDGLLDALADALVVAVVVALHTAGCCLSEKADQTVGRLRKLGSRVVCACTKVLFERVV